MVLTEIEVQDRESSKSAMRLLKELTKTTTNSFLSYLGISENGETSQNERLVWHTVIIQDLKDLKELIITYIMQSPHVRNVLST